jgi:hypothetical protein
MKKHTTLSLAVVLAATTVIVAVKTLAQIPPPVLNITPLGTNTYSIAISNGVPATTYGIYWTPVLGNVDYPWMVLVGTNGQTNFTLNMESYSSGFFMGAVSTNGIPPWELANPSDPGLGILSVTIDSPTNGSTLQ